MGLQPPIVRGRWWGTLLQVAGLIFFLFLCGRAPVFCCCPPGEYRCVVKRSKSGRGPSPQSGEAGGGEHRYRPGSNRRSMRRQPTLVTTMPHCLPYHVFRYEDAAKGFIPCSLPPSLWPSPHCVPLSRALSLSRIKGFSGCSVSLYPPRGSNPPPQDGRGVVYPLSHDELLPVLWSRHSVHQRCIASCVALAPLGTQH